MYITIFSIANDIQTMTRNNNNNNVLRTHAAKARVVKH